MDKEISQIIQTQIPAKISFNEIPRNSITDSVFYKIKSLREKKIPGIIEFVGSPGVGKTTIKNHLSQQINNRCNNVRILEFTCTNNFILIQHIVKEITQSESIYSIPTELIKKIDLCEFNIALLKELLLCLYDLKKETLFILLDDVHLLPEEEVKKISMVFQPKLNDECQILILFGRPGLDTHEKITIPPFTIQETTSWFNSNFGVDWTNQQKNEIIWLNEKTSGNPFTLISSVRMLLEKGILSQYHSTPLSQLIPFEKSIKSRQRIKKLYSFSHIPAKEMEYLKYLSLMPNEITIDNIKKLNGAGNNNINKSLIFSIKKQILTIQNNCIQFNHPTLKEEMQNSISVSEKSIRIKNLLNAKLNLNPYEKAALILQLKKIPLKYFPEIEQYADYLENNHYWFQVIVIYEKLNKKRFCTKYAFKIAKGWAQLFQYRKAEVLLKPLLTITNSSVYPDIMLLWCEINIHEVKLATAEDMLKKCMKLKKFKQEDTYFCTVYKWLITVYVRQYNKNKSLKYLNRLEHLSKKSELHLLTYYASSVYVNDLIKDTCDTVKICEIAIKIAEKLDKPSTILSFYHHLQFHYLKLHNYDKTSKYYTKGIALAKQQFDIQTLISITRIESFNQAYKGNLIKSQYHLMNCIDLNRKFGNSHNVIKDLRSSFYNLFIIGRVDLAMTQLREVESSLDTFPVHQKLPALNMLFKTSFLFGDVKKAKYYLSILRELADDINRELHQMVALGYTIAFSKKENESADESAFSDVVCYLKSIKNDNELERLIFCRFIKYAEKNNTEKMAELFQGLLKLNPDPKSMWFNYMKCLLNGMEGKFRNLTAYLYDLETNFDGTQIWLYHRLYTSLSKLNHISDFQKNRFDLLKKLTHAIAHKTYNSDLKKSESMHGIAGLFHHWHQAIHTGYFQPNAIDRFTPDENQRELILESLSLWDIAVQDEKDDSRKGSKKKIIVRLFGIPAVYIGNRQVSGAGKLKGKALEIFTYILLKSYRHQNPVDVDDLQMNIWPEVADGEKQFRRLKTQMFYLRNHFGEIGDSLFKWQDNQITINREDFEFILDIEKFESLVEKIHKNEFNDFEQLELAVYHYTGPLLKGIDKLWIEPARSYYLEYQAKLSMQLISKYLKTNRSHDALELAGQMSRIHPEVHEFENRKSEILNAM